MTNLGSGLPTHGFTTVPVQNEPTFFCLFRFFDKSPRIAVLKTSFRSIGTIFHDARVLVPVPCDVCTLSGARPTYRS